MVNLSATLIYGGYIHYSESSASSKIICIQPIYKRALTCYQYMLTRNYNLNGNGGYYSSPSSAGLVLFANIRMDHTSHNYQWYQKPRLKMYKLTKYKRAYLYKNLPTFIIINSILHSLNFFYTASHFIEHCCSLLQYRNSMNFDLYM